MTHIQTRNGFTSPVFLLPLFAFLFCIRFKRKYLRYIVNVDCFSIFAVKKNSNTTDSFSCLWIHDRRPKEKKKVKEIVIGISVVNYWKYVLVFLLLTLFYRLTSCIVVNTRGCVFIRYHSN